MKTALSLVITLKKSYNVVSYDLIDMCLSLDSSKRSLKCVLNHNGNGYSPVPIGNSVLTKERYINYV